MALAINFTLKPVTVTGATVLSAKESIEVFGIRDARFSLRVLGGDFSPTVMAFLVTLEGSMVLEEYGWTTLASFPTVNDAPASVTATVDKPLRYLRWRVATFSDASSLVFQLDGIGWP